MKLLNFSLRGIELETASIVFDLHNHFVLQSYCRDAANKVFELTFANRILETENVVSSLAKSDLSLVFQQVSFLHIKDTAIDETNICFNSMDFGEGLAYAMPEEFVESLPEQVISHGNHTFGLSPVEALDWQNVAYIDCIWGVKILVAAETVEAQLRVPNGASLKSDRADWQMPADRAD